MNSGIGFGVPDFGTPERNRFIEQLMRGIEDWLRLPYSDADNKVLTYDSSKAFRLKWSTPSGGGGGTLPLSYARVARITSDQTGVSGGWVQDFLQYNSITSDVDGLITSVSGDDITIANAGTYLFLQAVYDMTGFFNVSVDGVGTDITDPIYSMSTTSLYQRIPWIITTTGTDKVVKMGFFSSGVTTHAYSDGTRHGNVNFLEILKLA